MIWCESVCIFGHILTFFRPVWSWGFGLTSLSNRRIDHTGVPPPPIWDQIMIIAWFMIADFLQQSSIRSASLTNVVMKHEFVSAICKDIHFLLCSPIPYATVKIYIVFGLWMPIVPELMLNILDALDFTIWDVAHKHFSFYFSSQFYPGTIKIIIFYLNCLY